MIFKLKNSNKYGLNKELIQDFIEHFKQKFNPNKFPDIKFKQDLKNYQNPLGKTAFYDHDNQTITLFVTGRHIKDIIRSLSHELIHHMQWERGDLQGDHSEKDYFDKDSHLREMEREAYEKGNMFFRGWEEKYRKNHGLNESRMIYEASKYTPEQKAQIEADKKEAFRVLFEPYLPQLEKDNVKISIFPGSFKPPHKGHIEVVKNLSETSDIVFILISDPQDVKSIRSQNINAKVSKQIFDICIKNLGISNVFAIETPAIVASPVGSAYGFIENVPVGQNSEVFLAISSKDASDSRYAGVLKSNQKRIDNGLNEVKVSIKTIDSVVNNSSAPISATAFRNLLDKEDKTPLEIEAIKDFLPDQLSDGIKNSILKILGVGNSMNENKNILLESGLGGHMGFVYENLDLTFKQIKDIFIKSANGQITGTEKTDGQNIFISFSVPLQKAKGARNNSNIKTGGLTAEEMKEKFAGRGALEETFADSIHMFEEAVKTLSEDEQVKIFGPDTNIFYNCEVQDIRTANVIRYDFPTLNIHEVGHAWHSKITGHKMPEVDISSNVAELERVLEVYKDRFQTEKFRIMKNPIRTLMGMKDKTFLKNTIARLETEINKAGISDNQTLGEYQKSRFISLISKAYKIDDQQLLEILYGKVSGTAKGLPNSPALKKQYPQFSNQIEVILQKSKEISEACIKPVEMIIHDFSVEILKTLESAFVVDNTKEVSRLKAEVENAIRVIQNSNNEPAMEHLKKQLEKLKSADNVYSATEGFVFTYEGEAYKFTGNFTPINKLLGLFKYGDKNIPPLNTQQETVMSEGKTNMKQKLLEEKLRKYVRARIIKKLNEANIQDTPTQSTGINKLATVLKVILPTLESAYKSLTTNKAQRDSFRKYIVTAFLDTLSAAEAMQVPAGAEPAPEQISQSIEQGGITESNQIDEEYELVFEQDEDEELPPVEEPAPAADEKDPNKFLDVFGEKDKEKKEQERLQKEKEKAQEADRVPLKKFHPEAPDKEFPTFQGLDPTGRNEAVDAYKKTIDSVVRTYMKLSDPTDKKNYEDYLITNLLLYFDKYEDDISPELPDLSTPEYEKQKQDKTRFTGGAGAAPMPPAPPAMQESKDKLSNQILERLKQLKIV